MKTLRIKILAAALVLVLVCQAVTVAAVLFQAYADAKARAVHSLTITSGVLRSYLGSRHRQLATTVDVLASDFAFRKAVATRDTSTLQSALRNHASRVGATYAVIYGPDGEVVSATSASAPLLDQTTVTTSHVETGDALLTEQNGEVYQSVLVSMRAPLQIGWASMGFRIDDALATQLKGITGDDVSFVVVRDGGIRVAASTLPGTERDQLVGHLSSGPVAQDAMPGYFLQSEMLSASGMPVLAVLARPRSEAMAVFYALAKSMLVLGALSAAIAIATAVVLSGSLTEPLVALVSAARRIRDGDYSTPIVIETKDEIGDLARTVDSMQTEIAQRETEVRFQATHDVLTALPNRAAINTEIERRIEANEPFWIMVVGFVGIHEINSTLGLDMGDAIVVAVSARLNEYGGSNHYVARLSDTRFAVVVTATESQPIHVSAVALRQVFDSKALLDNAQVTVRASVGIAGFPGHARDAEGIIRRAWTASMDAVVAPERVSIYDEERDAQHTRRLRLIEDLRTSIGTDQLSLVYQPQYDLRSGRIEGAEALIRWRHPELGNVSPAEFIPLAEQSNSIKLLTRWVFAQACAQVREWRRRGVTITVSVNVSANDLGDISFPGFVLRTLDEFGVAPQQLELEITETALSDDIERALESLRILSGLGFRIAIDDFGTGFSSLAQLKRFPIDVLKIDRSFIGELDQSPDDSLIVRSTIDLAHGMGMTIVAEGVETVAVARLLAEWGAETLQGYLLSPPLAPAAFEEWLTKTDLRDLQSATHERGRMLQLAR
jgi:diguanylate cyclase (GGDEF)-like protein